MANDLNVTFKFKKGMWIQQERPTNVNVTRSVLVVINTYERVPLINDYLFNSTV